MSDGQDNLKPPLMQPYDSFFALDNFFQSFVQIAMSLCEYLVQNASALEI